MALDTVTGERRRRGIFERLADGVCRRAFSSPEALAYELTIAPALAKIVTPELVSRIYGEVILDVGCGGGMIAVSIVRELRSVVVGVDPSKSQMRRVTRRAKRDRDLRGVQAVAENLPFADNSFSAVVSSCSLKHWPDPSQGVAECLRVVRPGEKS